METLTADDFGAALAQLFEEAANAGRGTVVVRSGDLHRVVGGYPSANHSIPVCCEIMYAEMVDGVDRILAAPPKGKGASLRVEYMLPQPVRG